MNNDGWEHTDGDLLTLHDYTADGEALAGHYRDMDAILRLHPDDRSLFAQGFGYRGQLVLVIGYGGIKLIPDAAETGDWGYCEAADARQSAALFQSMSTASNPYGDGTVSRQIADVAERFMECAIQKASAAAEAFTRYDAIG